MSRPQLSVPPATAQAGSARPAAPADLEARLLHHLHDLVRLRHANWDAIGLMTVRLAIRDEFCRYGAVEEHDFEDQGVAGVNLIVRLPGLHPERDPLLVGAHYDAAIHCPGADDNATGVASLLELSRALAERPAPRPVWLVAFDQEESGLHGSRALARRLQAVKQRLHLMLSLEMLGYTSPQQRYPLASMRHLYGERGDFIAVVGNARGALPMLTLSRTLGRSVRTKVLPVLAGGQQLPVTRRSDHSPFWDAGYNAVMVTDTSFLRNPNYHQPSDTIASLDLPFHAAVTLGLEAAIRAL
jgi:hypothetical protein